MPERAPSVERMPRIVVLGAGGVGKSALVLRIVTDGFVEEYDPTIEDSYTKNFNIEGTDKTIQIVDTAGQEGFLVLQEAWIVRGDAFLLVYSITSKASFDGLERFHDSITSIHEDVEKPIVIVGNKCDLTQHREVPTLKGQALAEKWGCSFYETSAKDKINSEDVFLQAARSIRIEEDPKAAKGAGGCCIIA